jgi:hypothetical protein
MSAAAPDGTPMLWGREPQRSTLFSRKILTATTKPEKNCEIKEA